MKKKLYFDYSRLRHRIANDILTITDNILNRNVFNSYFFTSSIGVRMALIYLHSRWRASIGGFVLLTSMNFPIKHKNRCIRCCFRFCVFSPWSCLLFFSLLGLVYRCFLVSLVRTSKNICNEDIVHDVGAHSLALVRFIIGHGFFKLSCYRTSRRTLGRPLQGTYFH